MNEKRIVFLGRDGAQILGTWDTEKEPLPVTTLQPFSTASGRRVDFASLVRVTQVAAYYKEPLVPASYSFHEAQR